MDKKYTVDDRGNVAQFYEEIEGEPGEIVATLDREAGPSANEVTWDGNPEVTAWAVTNGYPEIASYPPPS